MHSLAHIVQGAPLPMAIGWVGAVFIALGGAGIFLGRGTALEVVSWIVFGLAFCAAATVIAITMLLPTTARITLRLASPASAATTSPISVVACGRDATSGAAATAPDGSNVLVVVVDGREVSTEHTGAFAVSMTTGVHRLRVELLDPTHRVFSPEVFVESTLTVTGAGPLPSAATSC